MVLRSAADYAGYRCLIGEWQSQAAGPLLWKAWSLQQFFDVRRPDALHRAAPRPHPPAPAPGVWRLLPLS